jgi:hypothetical protein
MRTVLLAALLVCAARSAADEPAPLLKPVVPTGSATRVRFPVTEGFPKTMQFKAQLPNGKKKSELVSVVVAFDTLAGQSYVSAKNVERWGYDPKVKELVLPELVIAVTQPAPAKSAKGTDATLRLVNVKLTVVEAPGSGDATVYQSDLSLSASNIYYGSERAAEPRVSFADKFVEFTAPPGLVKKLNTSDAPVPPVTNTDDDKRTIAAVPMVTRGGPVFGYIAVNGQDSYKTADGKMVPVVGTVGSLNNWDAGVMLTLGTARGCKVEFEQAGDGTEGTSAFGKADVGRGKLKELRLEIVTGPGLKDKKDFVLKDVPVMVNKNASDGFLTIGPKFINEHFKDAVYAAGPDGVWKLHGRVNPDVFADPKTRPKKP